MIYNSVYEGELPVIYDNLKPKAILFDENILAEFDKFSFGSKIGSITNKSTSAIALLPVIEEKYGKDSEHYRILLNRIRMCTKLQNAEIDKAKIGQKVKGIPKIWTERKYINGLDIPDEEKEMMLELILDRHPYFFIHLYKTTNKNYKNHIKGYDISSRNQFNMTIEELIQKENKTEKEQELVDLYYKYLPVIDSDSPMNNICKYIENINFEVKNEMSKLDESGIINMLISDDFELNSNTYKKVLERYKTFRKLQAEIKNNPMMPVENIKFDAVLGTQMDSIVELFQGYFDDLGLSEDELVNYLIVMFYTDSSVDSRYLMWEAFGEQILNNIKTKVTNVTYFPYPSEDGEITYLNQKFKLKKIKN